MERSTSFLCISSTSEDTKLLTTCLCSGMKNAGVTFAWLLHMYRNTSAPQALRNLSCGSGTHLKCGLSLTPDNPVMVGKVLYPLGLIYNEKIGPDLGFSEELLLAG